MIEYFDPEDEINSALSEDLRDRTNRLLVEYLGALREVRRARLATLKSEPLCPEGCGSVLRHKCVWRYGAACPRHAVAAAYGGADAIRRHLEPPKIIKS